VPLDCDEFTSDLNKRRPKARFAEAALL
jgi:hypothetical protein